jgi:hypothetical protein
MRVELNGRAAFTVTSRRSTELSRSIRTEKFRELRGKEFDEDMPMYNSEWGQSLRKPRFVAGDRVTAVGPGSRHQGQGGVIVDVVQPNPADFVYRYEVQFGDGSTCTFFGFELKKNESSSS